MRTVIILSILALLAASAAAFGVEPVSVGGDFGQSWLKNMPYQPEITDNNPASLWDWGGAPRGKEVVKGTLQPEDNGTGEVDFSGITWLGEEPIGPPSRINYTGAPVDFMYPFYSDDPWILAQHTGRVVRTNLEDLEDDIRRTIDNRTIEQLRKK
ncbi:MAG: hypothetical protein APR56_11385 [Methanosaeta sp. SDB]|uniref:Uncharacterized protein n=2 Tax=Methanothrix harundinacea TaxID=301375 RepID=A0A101IK40_9EURY|nr:MAG: hypothetical protein APR56_11385 [Methanosaeta sp. SDB]KUK96478.1 MAG: Uncharacterized protein XE07_1045 [Methanothrix harundinacea]